MQTNRKHRFSNPYSPQKHSIMSEITQRHRQSPSKMSSPSPSIHNHSFSPKKIPHLKIAKFDDQQYQGYKKMTKLTLGKERIDKIKYKLDIGEQLKQKFSQRIVLKNYYLNYDVNPWIIQQQEPKTKVNQGQHKKKKGKKVSIMQALTILSNRNHLEDIKKRIDNIESKNMQISKLLSLNKKVQKNKKERKVSDVVIQKKQKGQIKKKKIAKQDNIQAKMIAMQGLQNIAAINEQHFFNNKRNKEPFNIFKILTEPNHPMFLSGREQLQKLKFTTESIQNVHHKVLNQNIYKDLCKYARISAVKNNSKNITEDYRLIVNYQQILDKVSYQEIILTAKGQIVPQSFKVTHKKQGSDKGSDISNYFQEAEKRQIVYKKGLDNKKTSIGEEQANRIEIDYYFKEKLIQNSKLMEKAQDKNRSRLKNVQKQEKVAKEQNIKEIKMIDQFENKKYKILTKQLQEVSGKLGLKENVYKVKMSKVRKDKQELMRINKMIELVRQSKRFSKINTKKGKSKGSPSKSVSKSPPKSKNKAVYLN